MFSSDTTYKETFTMFSSNLHVERVATGESVFRNRKENVCSTGQPRLEGDLGDSVLKLPS